MSGPAKTTVVGRFMRQIWKDRVSYLFLLPFALSFILFTVLPVITSVFYSFTYTNIYEPLRFVGLDNYMRMFTQDTVFPTAVQNTLVFALITGPLGYILSFSLAWLINEVNSKLRMLFVLIFYSPAIAGSIYVVFGVLFSGDTYGYVNGFLQSWGFIDRPIEWLSDVRYIKLVITLCVLWSSMGAGFLSFVAGLKNVDQQLYEAAALDGLRNRWQELWYITIPSMSSQLLFSAVMQIGASFGVSTVITTLVGFPTSQYSADTVVTYIMDIGTTRFEMGYACTIAVFLFALMFLTNFVISSALRRFSPD